MYTNLVDLSEWKTKKTILKELKDRGLNVDERTWRTSVEEHNKLYANDLEETYIVHGKNGYKKTKDTREISKSADDLRKRAINMLWKESQAYKAIGLHLNLKFDFEEGADYDRK